MLYLKCLFLLVISLQASAEETYTGSEAPPATGWSSALKYFKKSGSDNSSVTSTSGSGRSSKNRLVSLDNTVFIDNNAVQELDTPGQWGLNLSLEWDDEILGEGFYIKYGDYKTESKYSLLYGFFYPRLESRFPLYIKGQLGVGYFTGDFADTTLAVDYNLFSGVRFFTRHNVLFNIEFGSQNYTRIFRRSQLNSFVLSSGLAFVF